jgi:hypothetical protein
MSAESKFTPRPWENMDRDTCRTIYAKGYEQPICRVDSYSKGFGPEKAERDANARLIAAAPDLLEALHLVGMSAGWQYMTMETRAVIETALSKAEGA